MSKKKAKPYPKKVCDPGLCRQCQYIYEGDFLCEKYEKIVISDWTPTDNYMMRQKEGA